MGKEIRVAVGIAVAVEAPTAGGCSCASRAPGACRAGRGGARRHGTVGASGALHGRAAGGGAVGASRAAMRKVLSHVVALRQAGEGPRARVHAGPAGSAAPIHSTHLKGIGAEPCARGAGGGIGAVARLGAGPPGARVGGEVRLVPAAPACRGAAGVVQKAGYHCLVIAQVLVAIRKVPCGRELAPHCQEAEERTESAQHRSLAAWRGVVKRTALWLRTQQEKNLAEDSRAPSPCAGVGPPHRHGAKRGVVKRKNWRVPCHGSGNGANL